MVGTKKKPCSKELPWWPSYMPQRSRSYRNSRWLDFPCVCDGATLQTPPTPARQWRRKTNLHVEAPQTCMSAE